jgi:hypothetical protein
MIKTYQSIAKGHAQANWYRKAVEKYDIPIFYTQQGVLDFLLI